MLTRERSSDVWLSRSSRLICVVHFQSSGKVAVRYRASKSQTYPFLRIGTFCHEGVCVVLASKLKVGGRTEGGLPISPPLGLSVTRT